jgi:ElaB/YqjD/DUF883 family membrane-anchored ribosome-binding protein
MAGTHTTSRPAGIADDTTQDTGSSSKVGELASRGKDAAGAAAGTIKDKGSELLPTAKSKVTQKADSGKGVAVEKARGVESDIRELVDSVREKQPQVADAVESVLDRAGSVVDYVERTPVDAMASDLQRQVRQRPWIAIGAMFGAGLLLSRALKPVDGVIDHVRNDSSDTPQIPQRTGGTVSGQTRSVDTPPVLY